MGSNNALLTKDCSANGALRGEVVKWFFQVGPMGQTW